MSYSACISKPLMPILSKSYYVSVLCVLRRNDGNVLERVLKLDFEG